MTVVSGRGDNPVLIIEAGSGLPALAGKVRDRKEAAVCRKRVPGESQGLGSAAQWLREDERTKKLYMRSPNCRSFSTHDTNPPTLSPHLGSSVPRKC